MSKNKKDLVDNLVVFLAKRDGIDKLVKTFQYVFKMAHWYLQHKHPDGADRAKKFEVSCGLSRKAFRTGRFLTGLNVLKTTKFSDWKIQVLTILGSSGEMVYFFFDHFTWMAKVGLLDPKLAGMCGHISASGESFGYVFFIALDWLVIQRGREREEQLKDELASLRYKAGPTDVTHKDDEHRQAALQEGAAEKGSDVVSEMKKREQALQNEILRIRMDRAMRACSIAAQLADLIIAISEVEPNPICCHPLTLGVSGLVSAWCGWYRVWPS